MEVSSTRFALEYYSEVKYAHCKRVVNFINPNAPYYIQGLLCLDEDKTTKSIKEDLIDVAWLHDIYEDTSCPHLFQGDIEQALKLLTHNKLADDYCYYLSKIKSAAKNSYAGQLAYWVKIADMKDHLDQTQTLTDKLKEKYLGGLAVLL